MKSSILLIALILLPAASASAQETTTKTTTTTTRVVLDEPVKGKIVNYFETYRTMRYGLPPAVVREYKVNRIPPAWITPTLEEGYVVPEDHVDLLVKAPEDLVRALPTAPSSTRYYLMGNKVVALDRDTRTVVSYVNVPTIKLRDVEVEVDEDGEVEVEEDD